MRPEGQLKRSPRRKHAFAEKSRISRLTRPGAAGLLRSALGKKLQDAEPRPNHCGFPSSQSVVSPGASGASSASCGEGGEKGHGWNRESGEKFTSRLAPATPES